MMPIDARKIIERADTIPLYLHAYAFHLNMRKECILPNDLLEIAKKKLLTGVKIHVEDGETQSLCRMNDEQLKSFGEKAKNYGLDLKIETSSSASEAIDKAVDIALKTQASSVRFYPRYEGYLQDVLEKVRVDIQYIKKQYEKTGLKFVIEQHEDLKSHELNDLVEQANFPNFSLLFDFGNMFNANELPLDAFNNMKNNITQVHLKDAVKISEGKGFGHRAILSGEGDVPVKELLKQLICLGDDKPQIESFGLEEEVDYYAPAFRFDDEGDNPWIPYRGASETPMPIEGLEARLKKEIKDAMNQISYIRNIVQELKEEAKRELNM
ncbi:sugar phosphate isomerase/epimerase [Proteus vulgaris]|uniref:sugar phosphate isomerase/epimerase family protein n=1 Tax=Proteus vulgaris TaxID=585 RepID=UPI0021B10656|nr:sugar phosphate isomerase/epimerase [Proteus vulgaris]MCT6517497.1 sugar phosphate isomerase/epimerase [Proteus vulgaris]